MAASVLGTYSFTRCNDQGVITGGHMPKISVIVPVYNVEAYLVPCINSILAQSFSDFELILVDDGSPDSCPAICDAYVAQDSRVVVIHQENQGQAAARNAGVAKARGQWVCFVDSDDIIQPQMLELLLKAAEDTGAKISMCGASEGTELPLGFMREASSSYSAASVDDTYLLYLCENVAYRAWTIWAKLIDRKIILKYPFTPGRIYEDNAVVCKWLVEAGTVCDMDAKLYFYRVNPQGTTKSAFNIKHLDYLWALGELVAFFKPIHYPAMRRKFCSLYMTESARFYLCARDAAFPSAMLQRIRRQMQNMWRKNHRFVVLSKQQKLSVYGVLYPRRMQLYWLVQAGLAEWKKAGLSGFLHKLIKHIAKKVKKT